MILKPVRPVLDKSHWQTRGLVGAWPMLLAGAGGEPSLTGKHNTVASRINPARVVSPYGLASSLTPTGGNSGGVGALTTQGAGGVVPGFPFTAWFVYAPNGGNNNYVFGRWPTSGGGDWLIADITGALYLYLGNAATSSYRYWGSPVPNLPNASWRAVSFSCESPTATPVMRQSVPGKASVAGAFGVPSTTAATFVQGSQEVKLNNSLEGAIAMRAADARVWNYATTDAQQAKLHADPWALYRPRRQTRRGPASVATSHAYYYRNFVAAGAHR